MQGGLGFKSGYLTLTLALAPALAPALPLIRCVDDTIDAERDKELVGTGIAYATFATMEVRVTVTVTVTVRVRVIWVRVIWVRVRVSLCHLRHHGGCLALILNQARTRSLTLTLKTHI